MAELIAFLSNTFVSAVLLGYLVILWLALTVWTALDVFSRTRSWFLRFGTILLVGFGSLFGFILYLIVRPQTTLEDRDLRNLEERILESQSKVFSCPKCGEILRDDFLFCTNCGSAVKRECPGCQRALEISWPKCPFCGSVVDQSLGEDIVENTLLPSQSPRGSIFSIIKRAVFFSRRPAEIKRGRGRPRKSPPAEGEAVKRPRGRPKKNG